MVDDDKHGQLDLLGALVPAPADEKPPAHPAAPAGRQEPSSGLARGVEAEEPFDGAEEGEHEGEREDAREAEGDDPDDDFVDEDESPPSGEEDQDAEDPAEDEEEPEWQPPEQAAFAPPARVLPTPLRAASPRASANLGCVLGAAIGDAMGHPTEFLGMSEIHRRYGPTGVTGFELYWERGGKKVAPYTDDTQMAEAVLVALLEGRRAEEGLDATMRRMAQHFVRWADHPQGGHRAPGNACLSGCRALARGTHWSQAGGPKAGGCGSVMRAYPFGLLFHDDLSRAERWSVAHSALTHRDPIALAASAAMAVGIARIVRGDSDRMVQSEMIAAACRESPSTARMMAEALDEALRGVGPEVTLDRNRGWAAHEAIAAALYVFARHPEDARAAILEGANTPGDSDSIATLAGALVGARVGVLGLPPEWVAEVERTDELAALALSITG